MRIVGRIKTFAGSSAKISVAADRVAHGEVVAAVKKQGLEGVIAKRRDSRYEPGRRSGAWVKMRMNKGQELVIGGYVPAPKNFDSIIVGYYADNSLHFAAKVGSGFSEKTLKELYHQFESLARKECPFVDLPEKRNGRWGQAITPAERRRCHWVDPTLVCQVQFTEWTQDGKLRQPVFQGLREDKEPQDVVRE